VIGHVQIILKVVDLHVDLMILSPKFCKHDSRLREVQEPTNVVISQGGLETIHEFDFRPVGTRSSSVELRFQRCK
jgi:hypothetical protein